MSKLLSFEYLTYVSQILYLLLKVYYVAVKPTNNKGGNP